MGDVVARATPEAALPAGLADEDYVAAAVTVEHADHPQWTRPVTLYFRRMATGWQPVGLFRDIPPREPAETPDE